MSTARERIQLRIAIAKGVLQTITEHLPGSFIESYQECRISALQDALAEIDADALDEIAAMIAQDHATSIPANQKH